MHLSRLFPLLIQLSSFRFSSSDSSEEIVESADGVSQQITVNDVLRDFEKTILENDKSISTTLVSSLEDGENPSLNETAAVPNKPKLNCTQLNRTEHISVVILNGTELQFRVGEEVNANVTNRTYPGVCSVTFFYATWCDFSAEAAPFYNALPRYFPRLNFYAIEAANNLNIFAQFGVIALPSLVVFHNGRPMYGFNHSEASLESFVDLISSLTGIPPTPELKYILDQQDLSGPVPPVAMKPFNYNLLFACLFLVACAIIELSKSASFGNIIDNLRNAWREAEIQHEHTD